MSKIPVTVLDDDMSDPNPFLVGGSGIPLLRSIPNTICVLDKWLTWTMRKGPDVRGFGIWEPRISYDWVEGRGRRCCDKPRGLTLT